MKHVTYETKYIDTPVVLCLGTFDGLHIGHQQLIETGKKIAAENGYETAVYSFENIPTSYLLHDTIKLNLFSRFEKIAAFQDMDINYLWLDFFDYHIAGVSPEAYMDYLLKVLNVKHMVVGFNYSFGSKASGTPEDLRAFGEKLGFGVTVIEPVMIGDIPVSSTQIRAYLNKGDIISANEMLGYDFNVSGVVVHGKKNGSKLGFPTINLLLEDMKILPKTGVYATLAYIDGEAFQSVTNIGIRPTFFDNGELTIETHILDFDRNVYGRFVKVAFLEYLSEEVKLNDRSELKAKIDDDVRKTRAFFNKN